MLKFLYSSMAAAVLFSGVLASPSAAQTFARADGDRSPALDRRADLRVSDVPLTAALNLLSERSRVPLAFSPSLVAAYGRRVSCDCEGVSLREALDRLLESTMLRYSEERGQVIIYLPLLPPPVLLPDEPLGIAYASTTSDMVSLLPAAADAAAPPPVEVQQGGISGRVTDAHTRAPVADVRVVVVGTNIGTLSGTDGRYTIPNLPLGTYRIRTTRIGYEVVTREIAVQLGTTAQLDFALVPAALQLDEVIVTGTAGQARRREVGNTITRIDMADVTSAAGISLEEAFKAQAPGMTVLQSTGQLGSAAQIRLRGNVSVSMSNQPLVYVDGVRLRSEPLPKNVSAAESDNRSNNDVHSALNDLNPADIERVEVIKGAAATTLYGTEAAAGVIQIFTKRGEQGAAQWTLNVEEGFDKMRPFAPAVRSESTTVAWAPDARYFYMDAFLRTALRQKYNLDVRGGGQQLKYFVSAAYENADGVLPNDHQTKYSVRGNFGFRPFENLDVQWNAFYANSETQNTATGNNSHGITLNVYRQERNYLGTGNPDSLRPLLKFDLRDFVDHLTTGGTFTYTPIQAWSNRLTVGYDLAWNEFRSVRPYGFVQAPEGRMSDVRLRNQILTVDYVSNLDLNLTPTLHATVSLGGQSVTNSITNNDGFSSYFAGPGEPTLTSGAVTQSFEDRTRVITAGFFGQAVLGLKDRYFLTAGVRVDGNSAFGSSFGLQPYPKVSLSYVISEEPFWPASLGSLKLRGAYGQAGRAPGAFDAVKTWLPVGWGGLPAYFPGNLGNADLGPERTREIEFGFEGAVFGGRLSYDFTRYHQRTTDALLAVRQIPSEGWLNTQLENVGILQNSGIESTVNAEVLRASRFSWELGMQAATNHSKVVSLGGAPRFSLGGSGWIMEGQPAPVIIGVKVLNPDEIADPVLDTNYIFGANAPTLKLGPRTRLQFGSVTLSAFGEFQGGYYIEDGASSNAQSRNVYSWPTCLEARRAIDAGRGNELTALERQRCITLNYRSNSHIYPGDFFKLREVSLRVPIDFLLRGGGRSGTLSLSVRNWYRWRNRDFPIFDPEMMANQGARSSVRAFNEQIPPPATVLAAVRVVF